MLEAQQMIYQGRVIRLNLETVRLPNQRVANLEIIHHPGGAAVLAFDTQRRICLLHQYRHAAQGWVWELPAGKIDNCEPPLQTAQRELQEEAGCSATQWQYLGHCLSSPGVFTEVVHLYMANDLTVTRNHPEDDEVLHVEWRSFTEALAMVRRGEIVDGKTLAGLLKAHLLFNAGDEV